MVSRMMDVCQGRFLWAVCSCRNQVEISEEAAKKIGIINEEDIQSGGRLQQYSPNYASQLYYSIWDVYSSNYVYNRLGAKERRLWDLFDTQGRLYLTSTRNASRDTSKEDILCDSGN